MIGGFKFLTRDQQLELKPYLAPYLLKKLDEEISQDSISLRNSGLESALVKDLSARTGALK
jgi:hypothetical protein